MTDHRAAHASPASRASEAGFALLEVIVSAAVLAIVAVAVLAGIDGAQSSTGREKSRSVAANLAEQDQERMRSMQVDSLADYLYDRPVPVDGSSYKVVSEGKWVRDDTGGTISCQNNSEQADYLQITSTVTNTSVGTQDQAGRHPEPRRPVGRLLLDPRLARRAGQQPQRRRRAGPGRQHRRAVERTPRRTNDTGCAVFQFIPIGNYNITLNRPGWVDHFGDHRVRRQPGRHGRHAQRADDGLRPGRHRGGDDRHLQARLHHHGDRQPDPVDGVPRLGHQQRRAGDAAGLHADAGHHRRRRRSPSPTCSRSRTSTASSRAAARRPTRASTTRDYFPNYTGSVLTDPGGTHAVTVRQPPLNFRVRDASSSTPNYINGATVKMTLRTNVAECIEPPYAMTTMHNPYDR